MTNEKAQISLDNADKFANALWSKIVDERLFSYTKTDICDYLLYLFNKHDKTHFLDANSNEKNEYLLKMNATKIKSSKKNISVKFMDKTERGEIFEKFLHALVGGNVALQSSTRKGYFQMTLEDPTFKYALNSKLKEVAKNSFDIQQFNSEKIEVRCLDFIAVLKMHYTKNDSKIIEQALQKALEKQKIKKIEDLKSTAGNVCVQVISNLISGGLKSLVGLGI